MAELFPTLAAADRAAWCLQLLGVAVALAGLAVYAFGAALARRRPPRGSISLPGLCYGLGILASLAWYVMPFLPQPRLAGLLDLPARPDEPAVWLGAAVQLFGIVMGAAFFVATSRLTVINLGATRDNVFAPARLLTDGPYAGVRHPMLMDDVIAHLTIAMALTGSLTLALFPIYYAINEAFAEIDERLIMRPHFGAAYRDYARRTPRTMSRRIGLAFGASALLTLAALAFVPS